MRFVGYDNEGRAHVVNRLSSAALYENIRISYASILHAAQQK